MSCTFSVKKNFISKFLYKWVWLITPEEVCTPVTAVRLSRRTALSGHTSSRFPSLLLVPLPQDEVTVEREERKEP